MKLRVFESQWASFVAALCARRDVETAGVILARRLRSGEVLLAEHLTVVPEDGYAIRRCDQLRIDPVAFNRLIRPARDCGLSVLTIHTHPGASAPWFSLADDQGDSRLMPSLFAQMPGPHGSIVLAGDTGVAVARAFWESGETANVGIDVIGVIPRFSASPIPETGTPSWFSRQRLALGDAGQEVLRNLHVAVIGLGGTGSVTFVQLAHLGVGRITVVDGDTVEGSNVSRILGAAVHDVGRSWKVDVAERYARSLGLGTVVTGFRGHLGNEVPTAILEECDLILCCVDRHTPRALLNRLSYARGIHIIDMGSAFRVDHSGHVVAGAGRVVIVGPGRICLACWGHIDPHRLRLEALPPEDRADLEAEGYVEGANIPQPSVIAFNTAIAGAAVTEFLRLVTHFGGIEEPPMRLGFDFMTGVVRRNVLADASACAICSPRLAPRSGPLLGHTEASNTSTGEDVSARVH